MTCARTCEIRINSYDILYAKKDHTNSFSKIGDNSLLTEDINKFLFF